MGEAHHRFHDRTRLTPRELDVLRLIATGIRTKDIAEALVLKQYTVGRHVVSICKKLDARCRTDAVLIAVRRGIIDCPACGPYVLNLPEPESGSDEVAVING